MSILTLTHGILYVGCMPSIYLVSETEAHRRTQENIRVEAIP